MTNKMKEQSLYVETDVSDKQHTHSTYNNIVESFAHIKANSFKPTIKTIIITNHNKYGKCKLFADQQTINAHSMQYRTLSQLINTFGKG